MPSLRKLRAGRIPGADASTWVGEYGTIFYNEATGTLRISDGNTPGGNPLALVADDFDFTFGDFLATTPADGSASLSSVNPDQDINIYSNGDGAVNVIGEFNVFNPDGDIYSRNSIFRVSNDGQVRMLVPSADAVAGAIEIIGGLDGVFQSPVNSGVMLHVTGIAGTPGVPSRIYNDAQNAFAAFVARRYNNTAASPSAVLDGEEIMRLSGTAHNGTLIPGTATQRITFKALGNQTLTNAGGTIEFATTPQNSTTLTLVATIDNANGITATKFTGPLTGNVTGTIQTASQPNITTTGTLTNLVVAGTMRYDYAQNNATVIQQTSKATPVTCNGRTGQITTSNSNIAKGTAVTFRVNNTSVSQYDTVIVNIKSGATADSYAISVTTVNTNLFDITLTNNGAGALTDTLVINFAVIKVS